MNRETTTSDAKKVKHSHSTCICWANASSGGGARGGGGAAPSHPSSLPPEMGTRLSIERATPMMLAVGQQARRAHTRRCLNSAARTWRQCADARRRVIKRKFRYYQVIFCGSATVNVGNDNRRPKRKRDIPSAVSSGVTTRFYSQNRAVLAGSRGRPQPNAPRSC